VYSDGRVVIRERTGVLQTARAPLPASAKGSAARTPTPTLEEVQRQLEEAGLSWGMSPELAKAFARGRDA
jgi:hypothetical protein